MHVAAGRPSGISRSKLLSQIFFGERFAPPDRRFQGAGLSTEVVKAERRRGSGDGVEAPLKRDAGVRVARTRRGGEVSEFDQSVVETREKPRPHRLDSGRDLRAALGLAVRHSA
ncbi:hypothetical protein [Methylopila sp. 73B]|uniref:hypothetical protein n=1 Tax=Methylopila sp. 73B TaxID=1120792 RepID=UPI001FDA49A6|nr:hypothetical protein [Methylopila sp. 73B]